MMITKVVRDARSAYDAATSGFWRHAWMVFMAAVGTYTVTDLNS